MTRLAQAAALAALADQQYLAQTIAMVQESKARIEAIAAANGLTALPSATNFVAIDCGWDGEINGQTAPQGIYVYQIQIQFLGEAKPRLFKGDVLLMR